MRRILTAVLAALLLWAALPAVALADETGDDPNGPANIAGPVEMAEATAYKAWLSNDYMARMEAPHAWLGTEYCPQQRAYWCGPAAVQTALTCFGLKPSQTVIAARLGTTTNGTAMSLVDDVLRAYTGRGYAYRKITTSYDFYNLVVYSLASRSRPMIVDVRIDAPWGPYRKDHLGHIICLDGFDWGQRTVRLNDSYDEQVWTSGGGHTGGHTIYDRSLVLNAIVLHPQRQVVY